MQDNGLERFVAAQEPVIGRVLSELAAGEKRSHWMWFVFPQLRGLGSSVMADRYGLEGAAEARDYDAHPLLGPRLRECAGLVLDHRARSAERIMGPVDALKLRSCATLFREVASAPGPFAEIIDVFYAGQPCVATLAMLGDEPTQRREGVEPK